MKKSFEGFRTWDTGGGCTAFGRTLADGRYVLITEAEDAVAPTAETTEFTVGLYDKGGNQIDHEFLFDSDEVNNLIALWEAPCPKCKFSGLLHVTDDDEEEYECKNCGETFHDYPVRNK